MVRIYTKTGDKGETSLYGGERVKKDNQRIEAYGTVDELNSVVGIIVNISKRYKVKSKREKLAIKISKTLNNIQKTLFLIGSLLAGYSVFDSESVLEDQSEILEKQIDLMDVDLPKINKFILPGGCEIAVYCHLARTVCRRAERRLIGLDIEENQYMDILMYLNRLSDYFFVLARYFNFQEKTKEEIWRIDRAKK